ncbi:MAG TPA: hypothetical protein VGJ80_13745 [Gemmatimonadales bacterium]
MVPAAFCLALIAQQPPPPMTGTLATAHAWVVRLGSEMGDSIWPGFRPDTIPVLYVLRGQGTLLLGWRGGLPDGFTPIATDPAAAPLGGWQSSADRGAASTGTQLEGRPTAQVVVNDSQGVASLVGLTTHEAFHVFEAASKQDGRRFGQGENSFLVTSYPVFDPQNEAGMALEGRILAGALSPVPNRARQRALARQFLAVRETRQRALGPELAEFEQMAELNEGLAEYTLVRVLQLAVRHRDFPDRAGAGKTQMNKVEGLHNLTEDVTRSIRLRYYATGPALGQLLDALAGPSWKTRLMNETVTIQDVLADVSGYRVQENALRRQAESTFAMAKLRPAADSGVARLRMVRRAQVDSVLAVPGVQLVVTVQGRYLGLCGIDPQNLLQVEPGVLLHTRWLRACAGDAFQATFNTPVVQDRNAQTLRAVVGTDSTVKITTGAQGDLSIESPLVSLRAAKAEVSRDGRVLTVKIR